MKHRPYGIYERFFKRPLDVIISLLVLVLFFWLFAVVALLVRVKLGSPVVFRQDRPGRDEKIFWLMKFRTMTDARDPEGRLLPDEERLTSFGQLLRKLSLDELPEFVNILRGDMSLVGPRPLRVKYLTRYNKTQRRRHEVTPGLTGLAQANGRNGITWERKFELDVEYVDKITFAGDLKIILKTIAGVFKSGSSGENIDVETEFMGSGDP